jgi:hypothetical protein
MSTPASPLFTLYPTGNRVVRLRPLDSHSSWVISGHSPAQIIALVKDLEPTTLNRYISGAQNPSALLSGGMTALDFVQQSINNCLAIDSTTMIPRLDLGEYPTTFFQSAQSLYDFGQQLNPPQDLISVDNWPASFLTTYGINTALQIIDKLQQIGFKGLAMGAGGPEGLPNNTTSFAMFKMSPATWTPALGKLASYAANSAIGEFELDIDFPNQMQSFMALPLIKQGQIFTQNARQQSRLVNGVVDYSYIYPIIQGFWDATILQSPSGIGHMYDFLKGLMNQYNAPPSRAIPTSAKITVRVI